MDQFLHTNLIYFFITVSLIGLGYWFYHSRQKKFQAMETILTNAQIPFFNLGLPELEKEVARSRRFNRIFSIIVISSKSDESKLKKAINLIDFVMLGPIIRNMLRSTDLIMYDKDNNRFIVLLPETDYIQSSQMIKRFKQLFVDSELFRQITFKIVSFPKDGLIIDDLIEKAQGKNDSAFSVEYSSTV
jgi:cellobiose-specific phosphotransferase system component IIB